MTCRLLHITTRKLVVEYQTGCQSGACHGAGVLRVQCAMQGACLRRLTTLLDTEVLSLRPLRQAELEVSTSH